MAFGLATAADCRARRRSPCWRRTHPVGTLSHRMHDHGELPHVMHRRWPALLLSGLAACASQRLTLPLSTGVETPASFGTATPAGTVPIDWWKSFGDPKLDELVLAGLEHNQDLLAAVARLDAAAVQAD